MPPRRQASARLPNKCGHVPELAVTLHCGSTAPPRSEPGITNIDSLQAAAQGNDLTSAGKRRHALRRGRAQRELGFLPGAIRCISEMNYDSYLLLYIIWSALISRSNADSIPVVARRGRLFSERRAQHLRVNCMDFSCAED